MAYYKKLPKKLCFSTFRSECNQCSGPSLSHQCQVESQVNFRTTVLQHFYKDSTIYQLVAGWWQMKLVDIHQTQHMKAQHICNVNHIIILISFRPTLSPISLETDAWCFLCVWSVCLVSCLCLLCIECISHGFRESSLLWPGETERPGWGSAEPSWGHFHPRLWTRRPLQTSPVPPVHRLLLVCSGGHGTAHSWNLHQVI